MIDHRALLVKYLARVSAEEGVNYVDYDGTGEAPLTAEEEAELRRLYDEALAWMAQVAADKVASR